MVDAVDVVDAVDTADAVVVAVVVVDEEEDDERGSSSSRSLEELSSLSVDRLLLANTKCLMARITAVALYACCKNKKSLNCQWHSLHHCCSFMVYARGSIIPIKPRITCDAIGSLRFGFPLFDCHFFISLFPFCLVLFLTGFIKMRSSRVFIMRLYRT